MTKKVPVYAAISIVVLGLGLVIYHYGFKLKEQEPVMDTRKKISSENFETEVDKCLQGESCTFSENPMAMYKSFKASGDVRKCERLIALLGSLMSDPKHMKRYRHLLKRIMYNFYPVEQRPFRDAVFMGYLGETERSLSMYLKLDSSPKTEKAIKPLLKLYIANTLYDLGRHQESLPYYEAALKEHTPSKNMEPTASQSESIHVIEGRMEDVKKRLVPSAETARKQ